MTDDLNRLASTDPLHFKTRGEQFSNKLSAPNETKEWHTFSRNSSFRAEKASVFICSIALALDLRYFLCNGKIMYACLKSKMKTPTSSSFRMLSSNQGVVQETGKHLTFGDGR